MLVFISDLHLRDEELWTVPKEATEGFLKKSLIPMVRDANSSELIVVFLGDLVDINRSRYWVDGRSKKKPGYDYATWSHWRDTLRNIPGQSATQDPDFVAQEFETHVLNVLGEIRKANSENCKLWRAFKAGDRSIWEENDPKLPSVRFEFIPGNHDRLVQYSRATRQALIQAFGLDYDPSMPFPWIKAYSDYSVVAFHGHVLSSSNFGGKEIPVNPFSSNPWYNFPSLGDVVTVIFGVGLVQQFLTDPRTQNYSGLVPSLAEIDLVRPQAAALRWLAQWGLVQDPTLKKTLDRLVVELLEQFLGIDFVKWWLKLSVFEKLFLSLGIGKPKDIESALKFLERRSGDPKTVEEYSRSMAEGVTKTPFARWLQASHPDMRYLVSGHTHRPVVIPLSGRAGGTPQDERVYFNTGTWLDAIEEGTEGGFARRNQIVHVTFYKTGEDLKDNGKRRSYWEYWESNLREGLA